VLIDIYFSLVATPSTQRSNIASNYFNKKHIASMESGGTSTVCLQLGYHPIVAKPWMIPADVMNDMRKEQHNQAQTRQPPPFSLFVITGHNRFPSLQIISTYTPTRMQEL
jgi:hypothetical protein